MPNYDYECSKCNRVFEVFQRISEEPLKTCPTCGGRVKRLIGGGIGIIFKGSGFYSTDNKRSSASGGNGKPKGEPAVSAASSDSSSGDADSGSKPDKKPAGDSKKSDSKN